MLYTI